MIYTAIQCGCGHRLCDMWQVTGIAPEAKFTERQAKAVAALLTLLDEHPDENVYARVEEPK